MLPVVYCFPYVSISLPFDCKGAAKFTGHCLLQRSRIAGCWDPLIWMLVGSQHTLSGFDEE